MNAYCDDGTVSAPVITQPTMTNYSSRIDDVVARQGGKCAMCGETFSHELTTYRRPYHSNIEGRRQQRSRINRHFAGRATSTKRDRLIPAQADETSLRDGRRTNDLRGKGLFEATRYTPNGWRQSRSTMITCSKAPAQTSTSGSSDGRANNARRRERNKKEAKR